jgi:hypothetical protein
VSGSWEGFGWRSDTVPRAAPDDAARSRLDLPSTLRPIPDKGVTQRPVFDPALKQYSNAYRAADPHFTDDETERAWRAARRTAIGLVLSAPSDSPWADALVLRGSVLLRAWLGDTAREPGDLDFVVVPQSWRIDEARTETIRRVRAPHRVARPGTGAPVGTRAEAACSSALRAQPPPCGRNRPPCGRSRRSSSLSRRSPW